MRHRLRDLPPETQAEIRAYYVERAISGLAALMITSGLAWLMVTKMIMGLDMTWRDGVPALAVFTMGMVIGYTQKGHRQKK